MGIAVRMKNWMLESSAKRRASFMVAGFVFAIILEMFLFNYKFYLTKDNDMVDCQIHYGSGLVSDGNSEYEVKDTSDRAILLDGFNSEVNCIRLNMKKYDAQERKWTGVPVTLYATDEANSIPMNMGNRTVYGDVGKSQYAYVHLAGKSNQIKIVPEVNQGDKLYIGKVELNATIPFHFVWERMALVFLAVILVYIFRPNSSLYRYKFSTKSRVQRGISFGLFLILSVLFIKSTLLNPMYTDPQWTSHQQYQRLAEALADGHFYLNEEPCQALKEMDNPYDKYKRIEVMEQTKSSFLWDHAYYKGKYYVYFGIVPELMFYLPYYLVTGNPFQTVWAVGICGVLILFALSKLLQEIVRRWFPDCSYLMYAAIYVTSAFACGLIYFASHADFYALPIMTGVFFAMMGMWLWLRSIRMKEQISGVCLCLGSLCMALVAGCRPQILLILLIVFPFFWSRVIRERQLFSKGSIGKTIGAILPFVHVAAGIMYYNYARFGSPFDFGANYNLTSNDMTRRFTSIYLCLEGVFVYFFQPATVGMKFPFLQAAPSEDAFLGNNIHEVMYGGFFVCQPVSWCLLGIRKVKSIMKEKKIWGLFWLLLVSSIGLAVVDTVGAGILPRYYGDFSWMLLTAIVLVMLALEEMARRTGNESVLKRYHAILTLLCAVTIGYHVMLFFANERTYLSLGNPKLYYNICYTVQFWL